MCYYILTVASMARKLSNDEIQAILENDIDDDFLDDIASEVESNSSEESEIDDDDFDECADVEEENEDDSLSENEEAQVATTWSNVSLVSKEPFAFSGNSGGESRTFRAKKPKRNFLIVF